MVRPAVSHLALVPLLCLAAIPAAAQVSRALTQEQVACDRARLGALLDRIRLETEAVPEDGAPNPAVQSDRVRSVFVTFSNRFGFFEGLVARTEWAGDASQPPAPVPPSPETLLSFHLNPSVRELLLNPGRRPLEQVSLTREISTSTLVSPADPRTIILRLDPTLDASPGAGSGSAADLVIDNLSSPPTADFPGFRPADTKPGRGLTQAGLTVPCHTRFTDFDRRTFAILQRVLRFTVGRGDEVPAFDPLPDVRVTLYRAAEPGVFLADVHLADPFTGARLQLRAERRLRIETELDGDRQVAAAVLSVDAAPPAGDGPFLVAFLARPGFEDGGPVVVPVEGIPLEDLGAGLPPETRVDWRTVLQGTAWNLPVAPQVASCGQGTAEEVAATPREDPNLEHMALVMAGGLTADPAVYERVVEDVGAIRTDHPELPRLLFVASWLPDEVMLGVDPTTYDAMKAGSYRAWDCLNDWYGLEEIRFAPRSRSWLVLDFDGVYDVPALARDYRELPDVLWAGPNGIAGDSARLCGAIEGETYRYVVRQAGGDCPAGCTQEDLVFFTSEPGERPVLRDSWRTGHPKPRPPWADVCG